MNQTTEQRSHKTIALGKPGNFSYRNIMRQPKLWSKRIKRVVFQFVNHCIDACYDLYRYLRYSNSINFSSDDRQKLESLVYFYYHKIEKALSLPTVKPLFGLGYIEATLDLAEKWVRQTNDLEAIVFRGAYAALAEYQLHVAQLLYQTRPDVACRLDQFIANYAGLVQHQGFGGTITISQEDILDTSQSMDFERFFSRRHSVRNFIERHIPDSEIERAVKLAQHTPSVCNRQCWRVHVYTSPSDKAMILQRQNGNEGFGHMADRVLLITADLRSFLSSGERRQASVDSGMFAMSLVLALEAQGIASCCLNLCLSATQEIAFRKASCIPQYDVPVMLILIGYPPEKLKVAVSARKPTKSMLTFHS